MEQITRLNQKGIRTMCLSMHEILVIEKYCKIPVIGTTSIGSAEPLSNVPII